ncbi:MAG TPA: proline--tRNA ligase [Acidimicrobiia bacterium]|nr:proline--tRNA ligase [Acidimicrobiia bacterium]
MRMSQLFLRTLRDDPADAEVDSHRLLVRAGYIRKVASGFYSWLPLGTRVLARVEQIVREEMDRAGAQEVLLPIAQPLELWERTGRDQSYGPLMFKLADRKETGFCLSPTAEELITTTVAGEYTSYRDLPVNLYQINWKYRDELRPRFGLLRAREFLMKDAYSFDRDVEGLQAAYDSMFSAYLEVFARCGLTFRAVKAQSGEIGGDTSQEFMAVAAVGEDAFVWCERCDYAANTEAAARGSVEPRLGASADEPADELDREPARELLATPDLPGIDGVANHLDTTPDRLLKCVAFDVDGALGLALVPGDREVNELALAGVLSDRVVRLYGNDDFAAHPELPNGYIGPDYAGAAIVVADSSVRSRPSWITGANTTDFHAAHVVLDRDFTPTHWDEIVVIEPGDGCPSCGAPLRIDRGIEVGHVFQLGTKYAEALGARYTDDAGAQHPMVMGCYGIGISRIVAAVAEEHHDEHGLAWPAALAPYDVHLLALGDVAAAADDLYSSLQAAGHAVLYDDRDARPGVKFADADLVGVPIQLVVGTKGLARGVVERKLRSTGERDEPPLDGVVAALARG